MVGMRDVQDAKQNPERKKNRLREIRLVVWSGMHDLYGLQMYKTIGEPGWIWLSTHPGI